MIAINDRRLNTLLTSVDVGPTQSLLLPRGRLRVHTHGPCSRPVFRGRVYWVFVKIYCDERYAFHILITYRQNLAIKSTAPADALSVCRSCCIFHSNYNEPTCTSWHLLHDIPDVTIVRQSHQFVGHRLIMIKRTQLAAKECIWNPDLVPVIETDWTWAMMCQAWIVPRLPQIHSDRCFLYTTS